MEYYEIAIKHCQDSRDLYRCVTRVRGSIAVTDLNTTVWVYGDMTKEEYDEVIRICEKFGEVE